MKFQRRDALFLLGSLVLLAFNWQAVRELIVYASDLENKNASQVFLIPFVTAGLIFLNRKEIFRDVQYGVLPGVLTIVVGLLLPIAGSISGQTLSAENILALRIASILVLWVGGFLLFYGSSAFSVALFPLLFLAFCIPIPKVIMDPLVRVLQIGSAEIAYVLIQVAGTPVYREEVLVEGFLSPLFHMPGLSIIVAPECSGIRSCLSMLILALLAGHLLLKTQWKRVALVLVAIPIMIFKNGVRIATLTLLSIHVNPEIIHSRLHREGGIPFFILALVLIYPILRILIRSERKEPAIQPVLREVNL
jgi:exosortase